MHNTQKLQLQNMINANNTEDYSELIRELKHSEIIRSETKKLLYLKSKYNDDVDKVHLEAVSDCNFIYTYYTDIYTFLYMFCYHICIFT